MISFGLFAVVAAVLLLVLSYPLFGKRLKVKAYSVGKALSERIDNPVESAEYDVSTAISQLQTYRTKLADLIAATTQLKKRRDAAITERDKYTRLAEAAAENGVEDDVQHFVSKEQSFTKTAETVSGEIEKNEALINQIRDFIETHQNRVDSAKTNLVHLGARMQAAQLREQLVQGIDTSEGLAALDSLEQNVEAYEAKVDARADVFGSSNALEQKYEVDSQVSDRVRQLLANSKKEVVAK